MNIAGRILDPLRTLAQLWQNALTVSKEKSGLDPAKVIELVQRAIALTGNASFCALVDRRKGLFLGFTGTFFSNSEWGSTQNVLMIVLHWSKQISRNCTHLLPNTRSRHTVKFFFSLMTVYRFRVDPQ